MVVIEIEIVVCFERASVWSLGVDRRLESK